MAIFINTDNSNATAKIYTASVAGKAAAAVETLMQKKVRDILGKTPGFTTTKTDDAKGYTLRFKLAKAQVVGPDTVSKVSGEILRYPKEVAQGGKGKGDAMVSLGDWSGTATATGKSDRAILDGVEIILESMLPKSANPMKTDMLSR